MIGLAELEDYFELADTSEFVRLEEIERNAVAFLQSQTDRYFGPPEEFEELIIGAGGRRIWLAEPPIASPESGAPLATLVEYSYPGATPTDPALESDTDFAVRYMGMPGTPGYSAFLTRYGSGYRWTRDYEYSVVYWRGYPAGEEPGDIRQLVLDLISVKRLVIGQEALRSEQIAGYSYVRFGDSDLDATANGNATINSWRRLVFA